MEQLKNTLIKMENVNDQQAYAILFNYYIDTKNDKYNIHVNSGIEYDIKKLQQRYNDYINFEADEGDNQFGGKKKKRIKQYGRGCTHSSSCMNTYYFDTSSSDDDSSDDEPDNVPQYRRDRQARQNARIIMRENKQKSPIKRDLLPTGNNPHYKHGGSKSKKKNKSKKKQKK